MRLIIENSWRNGDVLLTRPIIKAIGEKYPHIILELSCGQAQAYLLSDMGYKIVNSGSFNRGLEPRFKRNGVFLNMWFGTYHNLLQNHGLTYANHVHNFNRRMADLDLDYHLDVPETSPMIPMKHRDVPDVPKNSWIIENGRALSGQSKANIQDILGELSATFPGMTFYCTAKPSVSAQNIVDISSMNLLDISALSEKCAGLIGKGSAVSVATFTNINRGRGMPRFFLGWCYPYKIWEASHSIVNLETLKKALEKYQ